MRERPGRFIAYAAGDIRLWSGSDVAGPAAHRRADDDCAVRGAAAHRRVVARCGVVRAAQDRGFGIEGMISPSRDVHRGTSVHEVRTTAKIRGVERGDEILLAGDDAARGRITVLRSHHEIV